MIKTKVALLEGRLLSSQSVMKSFQKAQIGWKKATFVLIICKQVNYVIYQYYVLCFYDKIFVLHLPM